MTFDSLRAGKVREDERLASYVLGTCRRMAIGRARSTTRRQRLLERFGPELTPAAWTFDSPSLDLDRLVSCLERLAERERMRPSGSQSIQKVDVSFKAQRLGRTHGRGAKREASPPRAP